MVLIFQFFCVPPSPPPVGRVHQVEYSAEYENLLCGICAVPPETPGAKLTLTDDEVEEVSIGAR